MNSLLYWSVDCNFCMIEPKRWKDCHDLPRVQAKTKNLISIWIKDGLLDSCTCKTWWNSLCMGLIVFHLCCSSFLLMTKQVQTTALFFNLLREMVIKCSNMPLPTSGKLVFFIYPHQNLLLVTNCPSQDRPCNYWSLCTRFPVTVIL